MRLAEIKNVLEKMLDDNNRIVLEYEDIYGGGAKFIKNYKVLYKFLLILKEIGPDITNFPVVQDIINEDSLLESKSFDNNNFNSLNNYISQVTPKAVELYSFVKSLIILQEENLNQPNQLINIKLPNQKSINSLKELNTFNSRIDKLIKQFKIDGDIEFIGFDTGSKWYKILIGGHITYIVFLGGIDLAQKAVDLRKTYYESGSAKIEYQAAKKIFDKNSKDIEDKDLEKYISNKIDIYIEEQIREKLESIQQFNGKSKEEFYSQILMATKDLMKEINEYGTEFHLSLNPPEFASDLGGRLEIDYKKGISELGKSDIKELSGGEENIESEE